MEYYGNNDWRDYLAHYGVKGMKKGKHLPGTTWWKDANQQGLAVGPNGKILSNRGPVSVKPTTMADIRRKREMAGRAKEATARRKSDRDRYDMEQIEKLEMRRDNDAMRRPKELAGRTSEANARRMQDRLRNRSKNFYKSEVEYSKNKRKLLSKVAKLESRRAANSKDGHEKWDHLDSANFFRTKSTQRNKRRGNRAARILSRKQS